MFTLETPADSRGGYDHVFVISVLLLTGAGLVTLWTASSVFAGKIFGGDSLYIILRQGVFAAAGLVVFFVLSRVKIEIIRRLIPVLVVFSVFLCALTFIPGISMEKNGAARWIRFGAYSFQPSELVKLVLPLYLAHIFDKKKEKIDVFVSAVLPPTIVTVIFFILIYAQNNFSDAFFIAVNALLVFCISGVRLRYFVSAVAVLLPVSFLLVLTKEYRLLRVMTFLWPTDPMGADYQVRASILTINSGGFWGKGIGQSSRSVFTVPEVHSDFIFSAFSEEAGFIGVVIFYALVALFAARGYRASLRAADNFSAILSFGYVTMIISQTLLNTAVVSGAIPATGVPLPFFSAGGSSLATSLAAAGFIANVSRRPSAVFVRSGK